jgi:nicotinamidase-related amidase
MEEWKMDGKPALIILHMQRGVVDDDAPVARLGHGRAAKETGIIPRQQALIAAFRQRNLPVYFLSAFTPPDTPWPSTGKFWPLIRDSGANKLGSKHVDVIPELDTRPGEVLYNWCLSPFGRNNLRELLQEGKVDTLVVAGLATSVAISQACYFAAEAFYNVVVPSDASADGKQELHDIFMQQLLPAFAVVTTTEDVLAHL